MEKQIKSFSELGKEGQLVLISNPLLKDDVAVLSSKHKSYKYPIGDSTNKIKSRNTHVNGVLTNIKATDEGCKGDEMELEYTFLSNFGGGSYTFSESDDPTPWNIRIIDETHPKYDSKLSGEGQQFSNMMGMFSKMFGED